MRSGPRRVILIATIAACALHDSSFSSADESTARYFQSLRDRRLFTLAERYAQSILQDDRIPLATRTECAVELSKTFAAHAEFVTGDEHEDLWQRASEVLASLDKGEPANPRRILLKVQSALVHSARAASLDVLAEISPDDTSAADESTTAARNALASLKQASTDVAGVIARFKNPKGDPPPIPFVELRSLEEDLRQATAETLLAQVRRLPKDDATRAGLLKSAEENARRGAAGVPNDPRTWQARVMLVECALLRGDRKQAATQAAAIEAESPPTLVRDRLAAVQVRGLLNDGQPADAGKMILNAIRSRTNPPAELLHLKTLVLLGMARIATDKKDKALADELFTEAETQVKSVEDEVGGWWALRSRAAFEAANEARRYGPDLGPTVRRAKTAWTNGRLDEALKAYGEAASLAERGGHNDLAAELTFTRGSIAVQKGDTSAALAVFDSVVQKFPQAPKAAEAHLMSAWCLGRVYDKDRTTATREAYTQRLEQHRTDYPDSPTFGEATWMLAVLQERRLQYTQALPLYEAIPPKHARAADADVAIARCYETILDRVRELKQPVEEWESKANASIDAIVESFPDSPAPLDRKQAEVCLRGARLRLNSRTPDYQTADRLLERVLHSVPSSGEDGGEANAGPEAEQSAWRGLQSTASQLRVVSLAGQKRWAQAETLIRGLTDARPSEALAVIEGLTVFSAGADAESQKTAGDLQLRAVEGLTVRRDQLSPEEQRRLDDCYAAALLATNQPRKAAAFYEEQVAKSPKDLALRRALADALIRANTPEHLQKAKRQLRQMEATTKEGSSDWMQARYQNARVALALGEIDECRKLINATRLLFPEMGGPAMKMRFEELEQTAKADGKSK
ncbi:MAG: hypothetical protein IT428_29435 [Planctomycetaceae bacterium]|nr:hypothetical protein [Planctomycetaceae bacterium]